MYMVWHDHKGIQLNTCEMLWNFVPTFSDYTSAGAKLHLVTSVGAKLHLVRNYGTQQGAPFKRTDSDEVSTRLSVIVGLQSNRPAMVHGGLVLASHIA